MEKHTYVHNEADYAEAMNPKTMRMMLQNIANDADAWKTPIFIRILGVGIAPIGAVGLYDDHIQGGHFIAITVDQKHFAEMMKLRFLEDAKGEEDLFHD